MNFSFKIYPLLIGIGLLINNQVNAQEVISIYANSKIRKFEKAGPKVWDSRHESDTLILYSDGKFKNLYKNLFFDDLQLPSIIGEYSIEGNILRLYPKIELEDSWGVGEVYERDISKQYSDVKCKIIGKRRLKCDLHRYELFRVLRKVKTTKD